jgi:mono/diheme cytochrome c family protein
MQASVLASLVLLLGLVGCGSSSSQAEKRTRVDAALRKLEHEFVAGKEEVPREFRGKDVLGILTLVYAPAPHGVSQAEWSAAIKGDERLQRLAHRESIEAATGPGRPTMIELATPAAVVRAGGQRLTEFEAGKRATAQSGCLACHKIGANGNAGPGPDLSEVGGRLPPRAIAQTLIHPVAPMPSFKNLPPAKFHTIVTFLAQLK